MLSFPPISYLEVALHIIFKCPLFSLGKVFFVWSKSVEE